MNQLVHPAGPAAHGAYDQAVAGLLALLPRRLRRMLRWLLSRQGRWVRIPTALLCLVFSMLWFLPVVGLEYLPIALVLIARDVPRLQQPVGRLLLWAGRRLRWLLDRWTARFARRRRRRAHPAAMRTSMSSMADHIPTLRPVLAAARTLDDFRAAALDQGFDEAIARSWAPHQVVEQHQHPFDAEALVVQGEMWLSDATGTRHLRQGDGFVLGRGTPHAERYGPQGATYWVARRGG